jgi:hypothetical protein
VNEVDWIINFMGDPSHHLTECRHFFALHHLGLRLVQLFERGLELAIVLAQFVVRCCTRCSNSALLSSRAVNESRSCPAISLNERDRLLSS